MRVGADPADTTGSSSSNMEFGLVGCYHYGDGVVTRVKGVETRKEISFKRLPSVTV